MDLYRATIAVTRVPFNTAIQFSHCFRETELLRIYYNPGFQKARRNTKLYMYDNEDVRMNYSDRHYGTGFNECGSKQNR